MKQLFCDDTLPDPLPAVPVPLRDLPEEAPSFDAAEASFAYQASRGCAFRVAAISLKCAKFKITPEDIRSLVAQRFELLLAHAFSASSLGRTICALERQERVALVAEALDGKACSALKKRLSSLKGLVVWCTSQNMCAFPIDEQVLLEFTSHLRSERRPVSAFTGLLEACNADTFS